MGFLMGVGEAAEGAEAAGAAEGAEAAGAADAGAAAADQSALHGMGEVGPTKFGMKDTVGSGGFTGSSTPSAYSSPMGHMDMANTASPMSDPHPYDPSTSPEAPKSAMPGGAKEKGWMDKMKEIKSMLPGGGARPISMPNIAPVQGQQPQQQGQSQSFDDLMKYIEEQQRGAM